MSDIAPQTIMVVDDHDTVLSGTIESLKNHYPKTKLVTAQTIESARDHLDSHIPCVLLVDLSIPEHTKGEAKIEHGLQFLRETMKQWTDLNITVQSSYIKSLVRLVHEIDQHNGGFTVADKKLSTQEMLIRVDWSLQGLNYTRDVEGMRTCGSIRPEWYELLQLAFDKGLNDKAIAERMNVSERTIRVYWTKLYDVLGIYPEEHRQNGLNNRIQTERRAREVGLID
ncbi:MAG: response regulator transcription factor [Cyanobacteria bacterium P01_F01_bin.150]